jgi:hypothetical protein
LFAADFAGSNSNSIWYRNYTTHRWLSETLQLAFVGRFETLFKADRKSLERPEFIPYAGRKVWLIGQDTSI